jgi:murein DD-endopeptidase MepM/ murein hydrolase activator NlpD
MSNPPTGRIIGEFEVVFEDISTPTQETRSPKATTDAPTPPRAGEQGTIIPIVSHEFTDEGFSSSPVGWKGAWISGVFGERRATHTHMGLDIAAPKGTPIYSMGTGTVKNIGAQGMGDSTPVIDQDDGNTVWYGHASYSYVKPGQKIKKGELIGLVGDKGAPGSMHLHLQVRDRMGRFVDPARLWNIELPGSPKSNVLVASNQTKKKE